MIAPPPKPCRTRKAIRDPTDHERPARIEPVMNATSATIQIRLAPNRSLAQPVSGIALANASR
jgi:hypothetical protein